MRQPPFRRILVANRGEIACRIIRGIQELGCSAVAVYSDVDAEALHVQSADDAILLGAAPPAESYLDIDKILAAAKESGSEAIHPGYGFLSENAEFSRAVEDAGLVFLGPTAKAMEEMGGKRRAKEIAAEAGVPGVPGFDGRDADEARFKAEAERIGYPLLIKASAGGGGRGMRLVHEASDFAEAFRAGQREAVGAFGDGTMILEKYVHPSRHIEVQIFGDGEGGAIALGERECSVQRRHQKVLEESPSPVVDKDLRRRMEEAAISLAKTIRYRNAGTVEFLLDENQDFYFLEANTRLQVEHPVTELVTGFDLVQSQILLAAGASLEELFPADQREPHGWALEARICAEDPDRDFLPASGLLEVCELPQGPWIRVDTGFGPGSTVPVFYDSLIAKVIVQGKDRDSCLSRMEMALEHSAWLGFPTNVDFLLDVIRHPAFRAGDLRTDFLETHPELLNRDSEPAPEAALLAAALAPCFQACSTAVGKTSESGTNGEAGDPYSPWKDHDGFRLAGS